MLFVQDSGVALHRVALRLRIGKHPVRIQTGIMDMLTQALYRVIQKPLCTCKKNNC
jgi:hypothetical protein